MLNKAKDLLTFFKGFFLLTSYDILEDDFEQVILSVLNLHVLVQQFINRYIFNSIKETNWLITKAMCVLLFDVFNGCSLLKKEKVKECQTFTIEKN